MDQDRTGQDRLDQAGSGLDLVRSDITVSRQVDEVRFIKLRSDQIILSWACSDQDGSD